MNLVTKMILTLSLIGVISGGLLSQIDSWAEPKIEMHRKAAMEEAIFNVQPEAENYQQIESAEFPLFEVYDAEQNSLGYAVLYEGNGFQGNIRLMFGVEKNLNTLVGLEILEQVETPGLGTKVTETEFKNQFNGLQCETEVDWIKGAAPSEPNEIQAVTGATISSKSVVQIVNNGLQALRNEQNLGGGL